MPYNTPGVYVEEISTLPPSVAQVATAVPAFIGYTKNAVAEPRRVRSMIEFESIFGGAPPHELTVATDNTITDGSSSKFLLFYCLRHYFSNGGGPCYIASAGTYSSNSIDKAGFNSALNQIKLEDEPTLILLTDAVNLPNAADYYELCTSVLTQCNTLKDRFAIFDVLSESDTSPTTNTTNTANTNTANTANTTKTTPASGIKGFRNNIGINHLMYGAAYYPWLKTTLTYQYDETLVTVSSSTDVSAAPSTGASAAPSTGASATASAGASATASTGTSTSTEAKLSELKTNNLKRYHEVKGLLSQHRITLPPSAAIAGVYASVDRDRGVWKAPANVSLNAVITPTVKITDADQGDMNIDSSGAGKSINAIRTFTGKGTLVWGARTLDGQSNEWRYISVRRLFNTIEESARKATGFAVFEPNNPTTWLKVKAMIESYLYGLWQRGAFMGATPEAAYFVHVGLGQTMTPDDVLEGRMIVKIGVAAVRPAEFIILSFSHLLPTA